MRSNLNVTTRVLARFLLWPERRAALNTSAPPDWVFGFTQQDRHVRLRFLNHLTRTPPEHTPLGRLEDLAAVTASPRFQRTAETFLWGDVLAAAGLKPDFSNGPPRLKSAQLIAWLHLEDLVDPDAVLLPAMAAAWTQPVGASHCDWPPSLQVTNDEARPVLAAGVCDLHIHSGGLRNVASTWAALRRREFEPHHITGLTDQPDALASVDGALDASDRVLGSACGARGAADDRAALLALLQAGPSRSQRLDIDRIFIGRSLLWRTVRQPVSGGAPGLTYFQQRYFNSSKRQIGMQKTVGRITRGAARDYSLLVADFRAACGDEALSGVEIRMSPFEWAADYGRFLTFWAEVPDAPRRPQVRFAMHLLRKPDKSDGAAREAIDRQSAAYHLARSDPEVAAQFVRIDVAGPEAVRSGTIFAPYVGMLLADVARRDDLQWLRTHRHDKAVASWLNTRPGDAAAAWVAMTDEDLAGLGAPLGATWHAGEDYGDVLAGLYEIAVALASGLGPGSMLGHGLALCADPVGADRTEAAQGVVPARIALESFLWLHETVGDARASAILNDAIRDVLKTIAPAVANAQPEHLYPFLQEARRLPACAVLRPVPTATEASCALARAVLEVGLPDDMMIDRSTVIADLAPLIQSAQEILLGRIIAGGLAVELNPSSNLRIFQPNRLRDLPTVRLAEQLAPHGAAVVCTDNPGTFATSINTEYALLSLGLREREVPSAEIRTILSSCQQRSEDAFRNPAARATAR